MNDPTRNNLPSFDTCRDAFDSAPGVCSLFDDDMELVTVPDAIPLVSRRKRVCAATLRPPPPCPRPAPAETVDLRALLGTVRSEDSVETFTFPLPVETVTTILPVALTRPPAAMLRYRTRRASSFLLGAMATVAAGLAMIHPLAGLRSPGTSAQTATNPPAALEAKPAVAAGEPAPLPIVAAVARPLEQAAVEPAVKAKVRAATTPTTVNKPAEEPSSSHQAPALQAASESIPDPVPPAAPAPSLPPFDSRAALAGIQTAIGAASGCRTDDDPAAAVRVSVTFAPSGSVTIARVEGSPHAGTKTGSCVARVFRSLRVEPFDGQSVTVHKSFYVR